MLMGLAALAFALLFVGTFIILFGLARAYAVMERRAEDAEARANELAQVAMRQAILAHQRVERPQGWYGMHES
jgi:cell division protein FtsB